MACHRMQPTSEFVVFRWVKVSVHLTAYGPTNHVEAKSLGVAYGKYVHAHSRCSTSKEGSTLESPLSS